VRRAMSAIVPPGGDRGVQCRWRGAYSMTVRAAGGARTAIGWLTRLFVP
jgi:hypothetical protein